MPLNKKRFQTSMTDENDNDDKSPYVSRGQKAGDKQTPPDRDKPEPDKD
ncbi:hypothetical protein [Microbulbifer spongiae]|uniref:Multidrug transporter n=1 Tax=Microbulbifer spongiae TaxID=2944933 RepID=A0ABY9EEK6_9GAMM|nr:hypothetical protein [Microbulbifer sp. MI-G]WKD49949.1 hypothetical protein M8T91_00530 [Microbulbifer sp. MI-G]